MRNMIQTPIRRRASLLASAAVLLLAAAGCAGDPGRDTDATAGPTAGPEKPAAQVTVYDWIALHENGGHGLLAEAAYSPGSRAAAMAGELAVNDAGCFGIGAQDGAFAQVVFPHGTTINSDGDLVFDERVYAEGDEISMGGGGGEPPTGLLADAFEACGFAKDGAFIGSDEVSPLG